MTNNQNGFTRERECFQNIFNFASDHQKMLRRARSESSSFIRQGFLITTRTRFSLPACNLRLQNGAVPDAELALRTVPLLGAIALRRWMSAVSPQATTIPAGDDKSKQLGFSLRNSQSWTSGLDGRLFELNCADFEPSKSILKRLKCYLLLNPNVELSDLSAM